ncbi:MAG TPA: hypothetical protein VMN35_04750 [Gaiellaceae bacterium]|nr:hypothetical protein [Gaiellaceae bacterium]
MRILLALVGIALVALGAAGGWYAARETEDVQTVTTTLTETTTETVVESALPEAVEEMRSALLAAAQADDWEALRPLVSPTFSYSFGGPIEGGPIAYWQELERTTDERPLETLATLLQMPAALSRGIYVWPWAYTVESTADLSEYERVLLAPLGSPNEVFAGGTGYVGWRVGIEADGTWTFFVAGD